MSKPNLIGKILNAVRIERWMHSEKIVKDLWERNGLANPGQREGYKIEKDVRTSQSGKESTVWQLWKLVDQSQMEMEPRLDIKITTGIPKEEAPNGSNSNRTPKASDTSSPI